MTNDPLSKAPRKCFPCSYNEVDVVGCSSKNADQTMAPALDSIGTSFISSTVNLSEVLQSIV